MSIKLLLIDKTEFTSKQAEFATKYEGKYGRPHGQVWQDEAAVSSDGLRHAMIVDERIMDQLTKAQQEALIDVPNDWFVGEELSDMNGSSSGGKGGKGGKK